MQNSPPDEHYATPSTEEGSITTPDPQFVTVRGGIISQPTERTTLLLKQAALRSDASPAYGSVQDLESLKATHQGTVSGAYPSIRRLWTGPIASAKAITDPRILRRPDVWANGARQSLSYLQSVVIGLLLNILDAVSYGRMLIHSIQIHLADTCVGMILFPLSQGIFADLGPDGICMFYVSCIVSQLVFSCGGSIFRGGVGSEMVNPQHLSFARSVTDLN